MGKKSRKGVIKQSRKQRRGGFFSGKFFAKKPVLIFFSCVALLAGVFYGVRHFFLNSWLFTIKEVVVNKDRPYSFQKGEQRLRQLYAGRNIFKIDLKQVQRLIEKEFPELKKVEIRRNLPEVLEIDVVSREPLAVIDTAGGIVIDREGVVLTVREGTGGLVRIKGIGFFFNTPSRGEKIRNKALDRALVLLEGLRRKMGKRENEMVEYVSVSDRNNILLSINGVTVKMGVDDFSRKIDMLREILKDPNINMEDIDYIDLRFEDAVISLK